MTDRTLQLADLRQLARSYFDGAASPAHDWHHVRRVERLAERLVETVPDCDQRTVRLAVLLHDVGRPREDAGEIDDHAAWGAREARSILAARGEPADRVDGVCHAIRAHRYSMDPAPETVEAKLCADADRLDALGAVGLARCFTYGGELGQVIHDPAGTCGEEADAGSARTQYEHIHEKLLDLPDRMYTDAGRRLARERGAVVEAFVERFDAEVAGER